MRLWLPVGFFLVLALFPFYWMAITSLKPNAELYNRHVMPLLVHHPTLKHYIDLLTQTSFSDCGPGTRWWSRLSRPRFRSFSVSCWPIRWRACGLPAPA